jgi:hypothetical protein
MNKKKFIVIRTFDTNIFPVSNINELKTALNQGYVVIYTTVLNGIIERILELKDGSSDYISK